MLNKDTKKAQIDTSIRLIANVVLNLMIIVISDNTVQLQLKTNEVKHETT